MARTSQIPAEFAAVAHQRKDDLAERFGVSTQTIMRWRVRTGQPGKRNAPVPMPDDFRRVAPGKTLIQLQAHYGVGEGTVVRWRRACGLSPEKRHGPACAARFAKPPSDIIERYDELGSINQLMIHYRRDFRTIKRWITEAQLPIQAPGSPGKPRPQSLPHVRLVPGQVVLPMFRNSIPPVPGGREQEAAQFLRRHYPCVYRCTERGGADQKGSHWRCGNAVLTAAELIERAERKGWDADAWRRVA